MFKFDGVAGNPTELAMEMEAMLRTIAALRNPKAPKDPKAPKGPGSQGSTGSKGAGDEEDVWSLRCRDFGTCDVVLQIAKHGFPAVWGQRDGSGDLKAISGTLRNEGLFI